jgi:hypothetical protein
MPRNSSHMIETRLLYSFNGVPFATLLLTQNKHFIHGLGRGYRSWLQNRWLPALLPGVTSVWPSIAPAEQSVRRDTSVVVWFHPYRLLMVQSSGSNNCCETQNKKSLGRNYVLPDRANTPVPILASTFPLQFPELRNDWLNCLCLNRCFACLNSRQFPSTVPTPFTMCSSSQVHQKAYLHGKATLYTCTVRPYSGAYSLRPTAEEFVEWCVRAPNWKPGLIAKLLQIHKKNICNGSRFHNTVNDRHKPNLMAEWLLAHPPTTKANHPWILFDERVTG